MILSIVHSSKVFSLDSKYLSNRFCKSKLLELSNTICDLSSSKNTNNPSLFSSNLCKEMGKSPKEIPNSLIDSSSKIEYFGSLSSKLICFSYKKIFFNLYFFIKSIKTTKNPLFKHTLTSLLI